ncbi:hypothetical protein L6164_029686 [Bauhinia variegata]|uniref:Uncharacterized protein n=1 Tax=Bauhinia variegata TaxID=167791 RepID=A0ACB9L9W1_BAUVA|nr:hypothetical protein L6164_029686 [Bauhinia variegata]
MAEQEKETSSADPKKKSSLLDKDIGKEFLSSWKSISMEEDDGMDFNFDAVPKGKKKAFNFDKLDMDFNLDTEFDKISSFKLDMSDLDFSCPSQKPVKSKEKKEGESSGAKEGKQDDFNFGFDFNDLDCFSLDSSLIKGDKSLNGKLNKKETTAGANDSEGAIRKPKPNDAESVHASKDSVALQSLAEETSKVKTLVCSPGDLISRRDDSFSKFSSSVNLDVSIGGKTSSDICKTFSNEETDQGRELSEKTSTKSKSQEVINKSPPKLVEQIDSEQECISDQHTEVCSEEENVATGSGGKQKANHNKETSVNLDGEHLPLENSSPLQISKPESNDGEAIKSGSSTQGEAKNDPQPVKGDPHIKDNTKTCLAKVSDDRESQKSTLDCHTAPASSQPLHDTLMEEKEIQGRQSKYFPEDNEPLMYQSSTARTKGISFGCQKVGDRCLTTPVETRESSSSINIETGSEMVNDSIPAPGERLTDVTILQSGKDEVKNSSNSREGIVSEGMANGSKLAGNVQSLHKEVKKSKPILLETSMPTKDVNILSSQLKPSSLSEKTVRHAIQMSVSPLADISGKESYQKLNVGSGEGKKLPSTSAGRIIPALSSLKTSRITRTNKVLATSLRQEESKTSGNTEQNVEMQGITAPKNDHFIDSSDKQKLLTPLLKRKSIEVPEADLVSRMCIKRLSRSPSKSRSSNECSEKVEQVESRPNNLLDHDQISRLESSQLMNLTDVGMPDSILVEDNSNVEKAEAYTRELENICNMLKRKHEEAKELLVRAIVNNNNLLMLNHPIHEEKISFQLLFKFIPIFILL